MHLCEISDSADNNVVECLHWILICKENWEFDSKFLIIQIKTLRHKVIIQFLSLGPLTFSPAAYYNDDAMPGISTTLIILKKKTLIRQKIRQVNTLHGTQYQCLLS